MLAAMTGTAGSGSASAPRSATSNVGGSASAGVTGQTFGIEGCHLFIYKMMTSHGSSKRGSTEPWTIEEIGQAIDQIIHR